MSDGMIHWDDAKQKKLDAIGDAIKRIRDGLVKNEVNGDVVTAYGDIYAAHYLLSNEIRFEEEAMFVVEKANALTAEVEANA